MASSDNFINVAYEALGTFNRETTGFTRAVDVNASASRAYIGMNVRSASSDSGAAQDTTESMTAPNGNTPNDDYVDFQIEKSRCVPISLGSPETAGAESESGSYNDLMKSRFESAFRTLANELESYIVSKVQASACRAYGTAGTTPFAGTDMMDFSKVNQILTDNGCPLEDRQFVLNSIAMANLQGKNSNLFSASDFGSDEFLRSGYTSKPLFGFKLWQSAGLKTHTAGTGTGYLVNGALASGKTSIALDTGTGSVLNGDFVTFAGDDNKYIVGQGITAPSSLIINKPGLVKPLADNTAMTVGGAYLPSFAFHKKAIVLGVRKPALSNGDSAIQSFDIYDDKSGITFECRMYGGHRTGMIEVALAYGAKVANSENVAMLLG